MLLAVDFRRDYQPPTLGELLNECRWYLRGGGGHNDCVVRAPLRPAEIPVPDDDRHVPVTQRGQSLTRSFREFGDDFDGVHFLGSHTEHRGLVAGAGTDLQHRLCSCEAQVFCHQRNDVRL